MTNRLHKECVMVKSWHFNVLLDLPRQRMFRYPEGESLSVENGSAYFDDLLKNELVLPEHIDNDLFRDISKKHIVPTLLTTLVWEFSDDLMSRIISLTKELNIQFISVVFKNEISESSLEHMLKAFEGSPLRSMDLFFLYKNSFTIRYFRQLRHINNRVVAIMSESDQSKSRLFDDKRGIIALGKLDLSAETTYFNIHIKQYIESFSYNAYFNNRLFIDSDGDIKIDINAERVLGNITGLIDISQWIDTSEYIKSIWESSKERTDICLDCEFRNMCLDNRIPAQRSNGSYYHLTECNYNPYLAKWKGEEGYLTLKESGIVSNEHGFHINMEQLEEINQTIRA